MLATYDISAVAEDPAAPGLQRLWHRSGCWKQGARGPKMLPCYGAESGFTLHTAATMVRDVIKRTSFHQKPDPKESALIQAPQLADVESTADHPVDTRT